MDLSAYLDLFVAEAREHIGAAYELAAAAPLGGEVPGEGARELFRHVHSLKGMAASMGFAAMSELAHAAESVMDRFREERAAPDSDTRALLCSTLTCLERMVDLAERNEGVEDSERADLQAGLRRLLAVPGRAGRTAVPAADPGGSAAPPERGDAAAAGCVQAALILKRDRPFPAVQAAVVLGKLAQIGRVVRTDPPMAALRTGRFDGRLLATLTSGTTMRALAKAIAAIEEVDTFTLVPAEPPPPKEVPQGPMATLRVRADRLDALFELALELMTTLGRLDAYAADGAPGSPVAAAREQARALARRLYEGLVDARLVPFSAATDRLAHAVADLARKLGKTVDFETEGSDVRIDRALLETLIDPMLHMLRNAVDHGIEPPADRVAAGKPSSGRIRLSLRRETARLVLRVEDDGRGLDARRLKEAAIERGLLTPGEAARLDEPDALLLVALPGLSTAREPTEVSGRGVGMDVVRSAVESLGGRLCVAARLGRGTRFEMILPSGVALVQAFLVRSAGQLFAVPIAAIVRIAAVDDTTVVWRDGSRRLGVQGDEVPLLPLARILGLPERPGAHALLVERPGAGLCGIEVEEIVGRREIVARPLPGPLAGLGGYTGCALLDDGEIVLVMDVGQSTVNS